MKVSVVYWSGTGNTEIMANTAADAARAAGAEVELLPVSAADAGVLASDAILFGCPAMGAEELEESEFDPFFTQIEGRLSAAEGEQVRLAVTKIALTGEDAANFELGSVEALYVRVIKN